MSVAAAPDRASRRRRDRTDERPDQFPTTCSTRSSMERSRRKPWESGKRDRDVADRVPRRVSSSAQARQSSRRNDFPDRRQPRIFSGDRMWHSFLIRRWPVNRRAPDVSVWDLVPDLAIEVVSPTNAAVEVQAKIDEYFEAGVSRVWVIYPKQKNIHIYASPTQIQVLQLGDELDGGDLIPGFRLPLGCVVRGRSRMSERVGTRFLLDERSRSHSNHHPTSMPTTTTNPSSSVLHRLSERLSRESRAEVHFDAGMRGLYATDASLYQIEPLGVVVPRTAQDVVTTVSIAAEEHVPIVPRGAATSLSGQTIGPAIIIDFSKYLNRIGIVDRDAMTVRVEPGVVLDQLNAHLKPLGLMFGPDVSTSDRATIGGMIGNNSAGARSLRYGKTVDHVHAVDVVLADGTTATLGPVRPEELESVCSRGDSIGAIHRVVRDTVAQHAQAIRDRFPQDPAPGERLQPRRVRTGIAGSAAWALHDEPWRFNLAKLIVGSEGTLAVAAAAVLKLVPVPAAQGLVVLSFATIPAALDRLSEIVETGPGRRRDARSDDPRPGGRKPALCRVSQFHRGQARGRPGRAVLRRLATRAGRADRRSCRRSSKASRACWECARRLVDAAKDDFWKVRKAGFSLLMGMVGDAKPVAFVEDTAVDPRRAAGVLRSLPTDRRETRRAGRLLWPRRRRLLAHPTDHQRQDRRRRARPCGRSPAKSRTWSSSSAAP